MRTVIDDLPHVSVSRLRASGAITLDMESATIIFPAGDTFVVPLRHVRFGNGGSWSYFVCDCGCWRRVLRLYQGALACQGCLRARGLRYRVEDLGRRERAEHVASSLAGRLAGDAPARLHPRPGRTMDRRRRLETALWRAKYMAWRGIDGPA
jgi:hypothetical protein